MHNFGYLGAHDGTVAFCVKNVPRVFVDSVTARISLFYTCTSVLVEFMKFIILLT